MRPKGDMPEGTIIHPGVTLGTEPLPIVDKEDQKEQ